LQRNKTGAEMLAAAANVPPEFINDRVLAEIPVEQADTLRARFGIGRRLVDKTQLQANGVTPAAVEQGITSLKIVARRRLAGDPALWNAVAVRHGVPVSSILTGRSDFPRDRRDVSLTLRFAPEAPLSPQWFLGADALLAARESAWRRFAAILKIPREEVTPKRLAILSREQMGAMDAVFGLTAGEIWPIAEGVRRALSQGAWFSGSGAGGHAANFRAWFTSRAKFLRANNDGWDVLAGFMKMERHELMRRFRNLTPEEAQIVMLTYGIGTHRAEKWEMSALLESLGLDKLTAKDISRIRWRAYGRLRNPSIRPVRVGPPTALYDAVMASLDAELAAVDSPPAAQPKSVVGTLVTALLWATITAVAANFSPGTALLSGVFLAGSAVDALLILSAPRYAGRFPVIAAFAGLPASPAGRAAENRRGVLVSANAALLSGVPEWAQRLYARRETLFLQRWRGGDVIVHLFVDPLLFAGALTAFSWRPGRDAGGRLADVVARVAHDARFVPGARARRAILTAIVPGIETDLDALRNGPAAAGPSAAFRRSFDRRLDARMGRTLTTDERAAFLAAALTRALAGTDAVAGAAPRVAAAETSSTARALLNRAAKAGAPQILVCPSAVKNAVAPDAPSVVAVDAAFLSDGTLDARAIDAALPAGLSTAPDLWVPAARVPVNTPGTRFQNSAVVFIDWVAGQLLGLRVAAQAMSGLLERLRVVARQA
jgi:hypothetical protein